MDENKPRAPASAAPMDAAGSPHGDVRLLLVDDDPSAILVLSRMLARYPDQRFATSGAEALRLARESPPDLILLDAEMPGMTGFEVCSALRNDPLLAQVPVIFATSHDTAEVQVAALRQGAVDFLTKPLDAARVAARVGAHLRSRALLNATKDIGTEPAPRAPPGDLHLPRLLIVDDDVAAIQLLHNTLAGVGELYFAKSGTEALELAHRHWPDLILLDAQMPGVDGFEVCAALKAEPAFFHVPIVFVTRYSDPRNELRALDLGAADFIGKPYTRAILLARVRNLLELKQRTDDALHGAHEPDRKCVV